MQASEEGVTLHRLPHSTVKLLTCGQVITSVSSAVKELVENAIDAGATNIEIRLEKEGFDLIEIKDNGCGVSCDDVPFMCQRRYTSKIKDFGDLENLSSYGFRGEALYSLCAISEVTVITKTASDDLANCYTFNNEGIVTSCQPSHHGIGTVVSVQNLFKNLPVRKQFLTNGKRRTQELKNVGDIVKSFGLILPKLRITLSHNKFLIWQKSSVSKIRESLVQVIPPTVAKNLHEINYSNDNLKLQLLIPSKDCYAWNTCYGVSINASNLFINSRPVKNKKIEKAVQEQINQFFGSTIPKSKTPFCVIAVSLAPNCVDVNLDPNKTKVILKEMDNLIKIIADQVILYYFGALEPPKSNMECENISENNLKRKNLECTPKKTKVLKTIRNKCDVTKLHSDNSKLMSTDTSFGDDLENQLFSSDEFNKSDSYKESIEEQSSSDCCISELCNTEIVEADSSKSSASKEIGFDIVNVEDKIVEDEESEVCTKNVTVTIEEKKNCDQKGVEFMSSDESSSDSITFEILKKFSEEIKNSENESSSTFKTSTQNEQCDQREILSSNENKLPELSIDNITLSQWSRGEVKLNGAVVQSTTVIGKKELENKSNLTCNNQGSQERSISSQMGYKQMSAFTKFAKEMRSKIVEQSPGITFTSVAAELAAKWRDLHEDEKKVFADKAKEDKLRNTRGSVNVKDPPYKPKSVRYNPPSSKINKRKFCKEKLMDLSLNNIKSAIEKRISYNKSEELSIITTLEGNLLLVNDKGCLTVASVDRLKEAISFYNNLDNVEISSRLLDYRIPIDQSEIGPELSNVLDSLETSFDDTFNTIIVISDERITKNGFRIEKIPGVSKHKYFITDVPVLNNIDSGLNELKEILQFISISRIVKVRDCRPSSVVNFIKEEMASDKSVTSSSVQEEIKELDLFQFWKKNCKRHSRNCPHFRPICKVIFPFDRTVLL